MKPSAKVFIVIIALLGIAAAFPLASLSSASPVKFATYFLLALVTSVWKVSLPGIRGTMSANFLYVIIGVLELSLAETLALGGGSAVVQYLWRPKARSQPIQLVFNLCVIWIAIRLSYVLFHHPILAQSEVSLILRLAMVGSAYFLANTVPVAIIISLTDRKSIVETWRDCYFWSFPYYLVGAAFAGGLHMLDKAFGVQTSTLIAPVIYFIYRSYSLYLERLKVEKDQAETLRSHAEEMAALHLRTIEALALAIDAKDENTHDHLRRVQVYSVEMGRMLGLNELELKALEAAALLHDIGKLAVPEHILSKPGRLTPEEFEKIKIHPGVGAEILERVKFPYPVAPIVRHHHEQWNGMGYPDGLKDEQIPIGARILSAVDCLDALASDRQYRRALPLDEAMAEVVKESGKRYDPKVVALLQQHYQELEKKARGSAFELRLSKEVKIERGLQPAAGFVSERPAQSNDFLHSIGAARQEAQLMFELTHGLVQSLSLDEMLETLAQRLKELIPFDTLTIYLVKDDHLTAEFAFGEEKHLFGSLSIPMGEGLSGWVSEQATPILNGNPSVEPAYLNDPNKFSKLKSALAVPLSGSVGVLGTLALYAAPDNAFHRDHQRILLAVGSRLGVAIENSLRYRQAADQAATDFLTGLPNARSLFERLRSDIQSSRDTGQPLTVMVCDLDNFKPVNDRFGHFTGNRVLQRVAAEMRDCCKPAGYAARMGGDEFVIVLPGVGMNTAGGHAEALRLAVAAAGVEILGERLLTLSIGAASRPADGDQAEELLTEADRKMYLDKDSSRRGMRGIRAISAAVERNQPLIASGS